MARRLIDPTEWTLRLSRAIRLTRTKGDPAAVHQARSAARRLRVWLKLGGHAALGEDLRFLCQALGPLRDLHLVAQLRGLRPWYATQLQAERRAAVQALISPRTDGLLEALPALRWPTEAHARRHLRSFERRVLASLKAFRHAPHGKRLKAAHRLRRDTRALRFALDWLGLDSRACKNLTRALGQVNDAVALGRLIARWADAEPRAQVGALLQQLNRAALTAL